MPVLLNWPVVARLDRAWRQLALSGRSLRDAFMQYANLAQYIVALPINVDALDRRKAVRSGGIQDRKCNHPFVESALKIGEGFGKRGGSLSGMYGYGLQIWPPTSLSNMGIDMGRTNRHTLSH
ncbi:MAG: hypothetical protein O7B98_07515 [Alphaproteobacteria bacterium]|nr:hypothetical protein [Alphaproteobacteria bacterium]